MPNKKPTPTLTRLQSTATYFDDAGIERWVDGDHRVSQDNAFRCGYGVPVCYAEFGYAYARSQATSRLVNERRLKGVDPSIVSGLSPKADTRLLTHNRLPSHWAVR